MAARAGQFGHGQIPRHHHIFGPAGSRGKPSSVDIIIVHAAALSQCRSSQWSTTVRSKASAMIPSPAASLGVHHRLPSSEMATQPTVADRRSRQLLPHPSFGNRPDRSTLGQPRRRASHQHKSVTGPDCHLTRLGVRIAQTRGEPAAPRDALPLGSFLYSNPGSREWTCRSTSLATRATPWPQSSYIRPEPCTLDRRPDLALIDQHIRHPVHMPRIDDMPALNQYPPRFSSLLI